MHASGDMQLVLSICHPSVLKKYLFITQIIFPNQEVNSVMCHILACILPGEVHVLFMSLLTSAILPEISYMQYNFQMPVLSVYCYYTYKL